jgi:tetratricopeptide (TPR) repeat protein
MGAMRFVVTTACLMAAVFLPPGSGAWAAGSPPLRTALLIANAAYPDGDADLPTPIADAQRLSGSLQQVGFSVEIAKNVTKRGLEAALDRFVGKVEAGSVALFFFAGYAIQVSGKNYLIPVDARIWYEPEVQREGVSLNEIEERLAKRNAKAVVLLLDGARRNPFERRFRSVSSGLAAVDAVPGTLSLSSADVGSLVTDPDAPNSLFVTELAKQIAIPDHTAEQAFKACRDAIMRQTRNQQSPVVTSALASPFWFDSSRKPSDTVEQPKLPPASVAGTSNPVARPGVDSSGHGSEPRPTTEPRPTKSAPTVQTVEAHATAADDGRPRPLVKAYSAAELARKEVLDARIRRDPNDEVSISERGQLLAQHGEHMLALADFDRAVRLNSKSLESRNNRCWMRAILDELEDALVDCNEALKLRPNFVDALDSRGLVYLKQGALRAAVADYTTALKIDPKHSSALYGRGIARRRLGDAALAEDDFANAKALNPTVDREYQDYGLN